VNIVSAVELLIVVQFTFDVDKLFELYDEKTGGKNYYFHIKTERWAFDDIDELIDILKEVKSKVSKNEKV